MISVNEAKELVDRNTAPLQPVELPLMKAAGLVLAEDAYSDFDVPAFEQSGMDGYAFRFQDWASNQTLSIQDEIPAGRTDEVRLGENKAARIFTGAPLPSGADTVIMQEKTLVKAKTLEITDNQLQKGTNVRRIGSEISKGAFALAKGTKLTPGAIGFLATIGKEKIAVHTTPKVSIVVTGKEIQQPGTALQHGQVYECNSFTLHAALQQLGIKDIKVEIADDEASLIQQIIAKHLEVSDVLLITGGVSVGDYDFVIPALQQCGAEQVFHKIKQRPGKPLYFGRKGSSLIFGLPGNPSSVLTCYYEYVLAALEKMLQLPVSSLVKTNLSLASAYSKKTGLTHFLKGFCTRENVTILGAQESYKLQSFAKANCFVCLPEEREEFVENEIVEVHILP
jgi:molybdopterin molybdotransferase